MEFLEEEAFENLEDILLETFDVQVELFADNELPFKLEHFVEETEPLLGVPFNELVEDLVEDFKEA